jgi:BASS family bile acid:Na+ symporter
VLCRFEHAGNGAGLTVPRIIEPLRNVGLVLLALLANFVLMPAGAIGLAKLLRLDEPFGVGLLLLGCAAGAPFLPKLLNLPKATWRLLLVLWCC